MTFLIVYCVYAMEDVALGAGGLPVICPPVRTHDFAAKACWIAFSKI